MVTLGVILLICAVAVLIYALLVQRRSTTTPSGRQDPLKFGEVPTFGPRQLGPGAIVNHGGLDYIVRGTVTYSQGPFVWWEHLLEGGQGDPIWFGVEDDEGQLELTFWTRRPDLALQPSGPHTIDGTQFDEVERGQANYTTEGTTGLPAAGQMDFVDYASNGRAALLSFERWAPGMSWEVSTGRIMAPGELTVYPAPPPAGG